ncbi:MAG: hypothetical protein IPK70_01560 [Flavobacteriales bacterium]|jgi:hypothetical protein|nr:hypothetical protein [Flavobacteriales bacterium]
MRNSGLTLLFLVLTAGSFAQAPDAVPSFQLSLIRAAYLNKDYPHSIGALFMVTATDTAHFPPVLSMGIGLAVNGDSAIQRIDIQKDPLGRVSIEIFDKNITEKAPNLYSRIKDKVDMEAHEHLLFLFIRLRNISDEPIKEIELVYGLWEKQDLSVRVEQRFKARLAQ